MCIRDSFLNEGSAQAFATGEQFLQVVAPFYFVIGAKLMVDGVLRGAGAMLQFMTSTFTDLLLRCLLYTSAPLLFDITATPERQSCL